MNGETGALVDRGTIHWHTQRWILIAYLLLSLAAVISWGQGFTVIAFVAAGVAWLGQWAASVVVLGFVGTRVGRFLRRSWFVGFALIVVILAMAILSAMVFGSDAHTDGWTVTWRIAVTLWISTFAVRYDKVRRVVQQERRAQESLRVMRSDNLDAVRSQRLEVIDRVAGLMSTALKNSTTDSRESATQIAALARDVVRPLSHEVMNEDPLAARLENSVEQRTSWRDVVESVTSRPALRPWLMATVVFWAFFVTTANTVDQTPVDASEASGVNVMVDMDQFLVTFALFVGIFFVTAGSALVLQRILNSMLPRLGLAARLAFLVAAPIALAIIVEVFVQVAYVSPGLAEELSGNLFIRLVPGISIMVVALLIVLNRSLADFLRTSEQRAKDLTNELAWEQSRLECTHIREQRFFGSQLHGPLQSVLTAAAMRMSTSEPGTPQWDAALGGVREDFERVIQKLISGPDTRMDLAESLDELRRTWAGVCDVEVDIDDDVLAVLNADWISAGIVNDILVEACANAAIHGKASWVRAKIGWCAEEEVLIAVTNDGSSDDGGEPGMGSAMLDRVAIRWSRTAIDSGLQLRVVLAVPRTSGALVRA